jgi:hypothetical protein
MGRWAKRLGEAALAGVKPKEKSSRDNKTVMRYLLMQLPYKENHARTTETT